jgi:hypothetical protein
VKLQAARIKASDFPPKEREVAELIGGVLNPFIEKVVIGFNKNLTVDDNLPFEFKTIDVRVTTSAPAGGANQPGVLPIAANGSVIPQTYTIPTNLNSLKGFICINVTDLSGGNNIPTHTPFVVFSVSGKKVTIQRITGLTPNILYRLVLLAIS